MWAALASALHVMPPFLLLPVLFHRLSIAFCWCCWWPGVLLVWLVLLPGSLLICLTPPSHSANFLNNHFDVCRFTLCHASPHSHVTADSLICPLFANEFSSTRTALIIVCLGLLRCFASNLKLFFFIFFFLTHDADNIWREYGRVHVWCMCASVCTVRHQPAPLFFTVLEANEERQRSTREYPIFIYDHIFLSTIMCLGVLYVCSI